MFSHWLGQGLAGSFDGVSEDPESHRRVGVAKAMPRTNVLLRRDGLGGWTVAEVAGAPAVFDAVEFSGVTSMPSGFSGLASGLSGESVTSAYLAAF